MKPNPYKQKEKSNPHNKNSTLSVEDIPNPGRENATDIRPKSMIQTNQYTDDHHYKPRNAV